MGQLFYYKMLQFITKYIRIFTTKCNSFITKYAVITKCHDFITKYDVYYKLRQYNISSPPCGRGLLRNFVPLTITADKGPPYLVKTVKKRGIYDPPRFLLLFISSKYKDVILCCWFSVFICKFLWIIVFRVKLVETLSILENLQTLRLSSFMICYRQVLGTLHIYTLLSYQVTSMINNVIFTGSVVTIRFCMSKRTFAIAFYCFKFC